MQNFTYQNPTRIRFGKGVLSEVGNGLGNLSAKRILLVYGKGSIKRNGVYEAVTSALASQLP